MARPSTIESTIYLTMTGVMKQLGMSRPQIKKRLETGVFPPPTQVNSHGVRLFDAVWLRQTQLIVSCERKKITPFELKAELERLEFRQMERELVQ
jgi:predicted DNA-binding transcriptional regulator AlpA